MDGTTMDCYAVDLSAMWAMDAHHLALLADALGKTGDAKRFRQDETEMNKRINDRLWNDKLGVYCSRFWDDAKSYTPVDDAAFGSSSGSGFDGEYFSDEELRQKVGVNRVASLHFDWDKGPPIPALASVKPWSARWTATFTPPATTTYRFDIAARDGIRLTVDGKAIRKDWAAHGNRRSLSATIDLTAGKPVTVTLENFQRSLGSQLHLAVTQLEPINGAFLTRLTPMNFYPLSSGAPDAGRAQRMLAILTDPKKFWGPTCCPPSPSMIPIICNRNTGAATSGAR